MRRLRASFAALLVLCAVRVFAADDNTIIVPGASRAESPGKSAGSTVNSVTLVVGVALAAVGGWLVLRNRGGKPIGRDQRLLAVDETRSLGSRQYLVVASYEGRKFLLGVCPGRIDLLAPLDGSGTVAAGKRAE